MTTKQRTATIQFATDTKEIGSDMNLSGIADRKLSEKFKCLNIRAGKFSPMWGSNKDFHGTEILAVAHSSTDDVAQILTTDCRVLSV